MSSLALGCSVPPGWWLLVVRGLVCARRAQLGTWAACWPPVPLPLPGVWYAAGSVLRACLVAAFGAVGAVVVGATVFLVCAARLCAVYLAASAGTYCRVGAVASTLAAASAREVAARCPVGSSRRCHPLPLPGGPAAHADSTGASRPRPPVTLPLSPLPWLGGGAAKMPGLVCV